MTDPDTDRAYAIRVGNRWFVRFSKGRALTAWSLAGATLFGPWRQFEVAQTIERIKKRGREVSWVIVSVEWQ